MSPTEIDPLEVNVPWAYYEANTTIAYAWATAVGAGDVQPPALGEYTGEDRDGHREIAYQADDILSEMQCQTEMAPWPIARAIPPGTRDVSQLWPTNYGPIAMHTRSFLDLNRVGKGTRKLWSLCHFGGWKGCTIIRDERLGDGLAEIFEGPASERIVRGENRRLRKATPDECSNMSTAYYNNARNAALKGMVEIWSSTIPDSKEKYFIIQISPTAYVLEGGVHDMLRNAADPDPRARHLLNSAIWRRKGEDEVVGYSYLGWDAKGSSVDVTIEADTIAATAAVPTPNVESGTRWDLNPADHPINTVTPIKEYFVSWVEETGAMISSIWSTEFGTNGLRGAIEFLTDDDQYACYEYATEDRWPQTEEFDEWRQNKSKLHHTHLEAGKEISMSEKVLQAIAILPNDAQHEAVFDVREVLMRIVRFNLDVRGKYAYQYDLESPA